MKSSAIIDNYRNYINTKEGLKTSLIVYSVMIESFTESIESGEIELVETILKTDFWKKFGSVRDIKTGSVYLEYDICFCVKHQF